MSLKNRSCKIENEESNLGSEILSISTSFLVNLVKQSNLFLMEFTLI